MKDSTATSAQETRCPFCASPLAEGASFCPNCARSIKPRARQKAPRPLQKKFLHAAALVTALAVIAGGIWLYTRPQTVEGDGGVVYTDTDGSYQVVVGTSDGSYEPLAEVH